MEPHNSTNPTRALHIPVQVQSLMLVSLLKVLAEQNQLSGHAYVRRQYGEELSESRACDQPPGISAPSCISLLLNFCSVIHKYLYSDRSSFKTLISSWRRVISSWSRAISSCAALSAASRRAIYSRSSLSVCTAELAVLAAIKLNV